MRRTLLLAAALLLPAAAGAEDAASELEMFGSPEVATQAAAAPAAPEEKKSLGFSGEAVSVLEGVAASTHNPVNSYITGNFMLDARLKNGVKAFANMEATYNPRARETVSDLREVFLDFNLKDRVYFRTGKQVLQWGRCSLWNPTDLINIEKKPFIRKIGYRDGAYGVKFHAPFGTDYNVYGFLDTGSAQEDRELGGALKFEFLAGRTEMAFSGWGRRGRSAVFGYDVSSRLGGVDVAGELAVAGRDNTRYVRDEAGTLYTYLKGDDWTTRAALNLSRGFRLGEFNDRLIVSTEFYYNQNGYTRSPFRDRAVYNYSGPLALLSATGSRRDFLIGSGLYEPNYMGRYYGALFTSVSRFIVTDMTLSANYVRNLSDDTGLLSTGVTYRNLNDFSAGCLVNAYLGRPRGEYTFSGAKMSVQLTAGVSF